MALLEAKVCFSCFLNGDCMTKRVAPVKKNDTVTLTINDIGNEGQGIGKFEGYTLFVDGALPGETVEATVIKVGKNFGIGKLSQVITPSEDRIEPTCPIARQCGGCSLQHLSYEGQLAFKQNKVKQLLQRVGKVEDVEVPPTIGMDEPWHYRNKVQFPVRNVNGAIKIGYYAKRSHRIVETDICYIQDRRNEAIREILLTWMEKHNISAYHEESNKGIVRHLVTRHSYETGKMHVTLVINARRLNFVENLIEALAKCGYVSGFGLNINREQTNVILGKRMMHLYGDTFIEDSIDGVRFHMSPLSFFQVNPVQTQKLYGKALEFADLSGDETVLDLYSGIGSISLFLAQKAKKVIGVEVVPEAVENARHNATINEITNTEFYVGRAEEVVPRLFKNDGVRADVVVVDPPRKGCDEELLKTIVEIGPKKLVYVSCDPGTLARDILYLTEHGFKLEKVQPIDMFPHSTHVECCSLLTRTV